MPNHGLIQGLITLLTLATFIGICWWAYRPSSRMRFEEDGWLAFGDEQPSPERTEQDGLPDEQVQRDDLGDPR
jgi:cytochrome c oxidase cbb3-type subunit 4